MATPMANSSGRLANTAPPAALIASKNGPTTGVLIPPSRSGWPSRSRMPAAGSSAIGSIRLLPRRCNWANPGSRRPDFFLVAFSAVLVTDGLRSRRRAGSDPATPRDLGWWAGRRVGPQGGKGPWFSPPGGEPISGDQDRRWIGVDQLEVEDWHRPIAPSRARSM